MAPAAKANQAGQASFTVYMAETTWRALRRYADENDTSRSAVIEAAVEHLLASTPVDQVPVRERAQAITTDRRRRAE